MASDASSLLDSEIAGVRVIDLRGQWDNGFYGVILKALMLGRTPPDPGQAPQFSGVGYLAVTDSELVLLQLAPGLALKPVDVISRIPRSNVVSAEVGKGISPRLTITFADGQIWQFRIANPGILAIVPSGNWRRHGRRVADALQSGAVATP